MAASTMDELRLAADGVSAAFQEGASARTQVKQRFDLQVVAGNMAPAAECIDRYVRAELDFETPGDRGLGRASTNVPRLGAFFRSELRATPRAVREAIEQDVRAIIWRGYLCTVLLMEPSVRMGGGSADELFEEWIPRIYSATPPPGLWNVAMAAGDSALEKLRSTLKKAGMVKGGLFSKGKTIEIATYYLLGGLLLGDEDKRASV